MKYKLFTKSILAYSIIFLFFSCEKRQVEAEIPAPHPEPVIIYDIVINGGRVMDPETGFDAVANVGITGDRIARISENPLEGARVIDAAGKVVSPGFIDTCVAVSEKTAQRHWNVLYWKVSDGVTSAFWVHDGTGYIDDYKEMLVEQPLPVNYGFGTRISDYYVKRVDFENRLRLARENIDKGALSVSVSPEYQNWMTFEELTAYAGVAKEKNVPLMIHLRYSHEYDELDGVAEIIRVARLTGAHIYIFHLSSTGGTYHMDKALAMINRARSEGVKVDASVYPYTYWMTFINSSRFNPGWRKAYGLSPEDIYYLPKKMYLTEDNWVKYRRRGGLVTVPEGTIPWETSIYPALQEDYIFICSDGSYYEHPDDEDKDFGHPRDTGTFAHSIALAREHNIPLMTMLGKMTLLPANLMTESVPGYKYRGRLQEGCYADITIFDPLTTKGMGTVEEPGHVSAGIQTVLVNGTVAWHNGVLTDDTAGRWILRGEE